MMGYAILLAALLAASPANAADASTCYTIASADQRAYCLAKAHRDPGRCYSVQDAGLRAQCLAEVRR